jgi:hypothetical protein
MIVSAFAGLMLLARGAAAEQPLEGADDAREELRASIDRLAEKRFLHGFRLGYLYLMNMDGPADPTDPASLSLADKYGLRSPHQFIIGYEVTWRLIGYDWLNTLLVGNVMISGLEQSKFIPNANLVIGFELAETLQLGVGVNVVPQEEKPAHMLAAIGWTPRVGDFYLPIHAFFVPDVDGQHRTGLTIGVNW